MAKAIEKGAFFMANSQLQNQKQSQRRKVADCRDFPSETQCTLTISGTEDEVLRAATEHAVSVHGHQNTPELKEQIRKMLKDESTQIESGQGPLHQVA
jgi:predicted small metal-binding protein